MSFTPGDLKSTIAQAKEAIGGNGSTSFTDWEVVLTEHEALLSAVLSGSTKQEAQNVLKWMSAMRKANEDLYNAQCQFDYACTDALNAY